MATDITTPDSESPSHNNKPMGFLAYANGALNRHYPTANPESPPPTVAVSYKECMRNHAASIGGHALDGCCEFMPSPMFNPLVPTSLRCAACGCHRNFHRQNNAPPLADSPSSPPTPATAPHMLMTLRKTQSAVTPATTNKSGKKRFRTKFSQDQKERMFDFAERLGWKMQRTDKTTVQDFCSEIGVGKEVLKVWMHNNKNTLGRKDSGGNGATPAAAAGGHNNNGGDRFGRVHLVSANASSSSD